MLIFQVSWQSFAKEIHTYHVVAYKVSHIVGGDEGEVDIEVEVKERKERKKVWMS
jgi:hypothetical protein